MVGLLPTQGRVSRNGVMPMSFSLDAIGPLARTVRDAARLLDVIAGPDPRDASCAAVPPPRAEAALDGNIAGLRIGVPDRYFLDDLDPDVGAALEEGMAEFRRHGAAVVPVAMPDWIGDAAALHPPVMKAEGAANHWEWMHERRGDYSTEVGNRLEAGFFVSAVDYIQALKLRGAFLGDFLTSVFDRVDLLHTPVMVKRLPSIAEARPTSGPDYLRMVVMLTRNTRVVSFLGLPAVSLLCGTDDRGLPVAMQLIGRPFAEATLLRAADAHERAAGWTAAAPV